MPDDVEEPRGQFVGEAMARGERDVPVGRATNGD
jgi:hypothetical protein